MDKWLISVDTTADIPEEYLKANNILEQPLHYIVEGKEYGKDIEELPIKEFYAKIRDGVMPTTSATNIDYIKNQMEAAIKDGYAILHLPFSAAMSASCSNAILAKNMICDEYPEAKIEVVDTLSATCGVYALVMKLVDMKNNGASFEEAVEFAKSYIGKLRVWFSVKDLMHLYKGGRLKKSTAIIATIAGINPILKVNSEGKLESHDKVRGRKKALAYLAEGIKDCAEFDKIEAVSIAHGDCEEDALELAGKIKELYPHIKTVSVNYLSQTLGSHTGPDAIVIGYMSGEN